MAYFVFFRPIGELTPKAGTGTASKPRSSAGAHGPAGESTKGLLPELGGHAFRISVNKESMLGYVACEQLRDAEKFLRNIPGVNYQFIPIRVEEWSTCVEDWQTKKSLLKLY